MRSVRLALLLAALLGALCAAAKGLPKGLDRVAAEGGGIVTGFNPDEAEAALRGMPLHAVEGVWQWADIDTRVVITRTAATPADLPAAIYSIVVLHASDPSLRPGTVIGYLATTAKRDTYDARLYTRSSPRDGSLTSPATYTLTLEDSETRLSVRPYGHKLRFNWWRLLPYPYRSLLSPIRRSDTDAAGLLRIYPSPGKPLHPVYL